MKRRGRKLLTEADFKHRKETWVSYVGLLDMTHKEIAEITGLAERTVAGYSHPQSRSTPSQRAVNKLAVEIVHRKDEIETRKTAELKAQQVIEDLRKLTSAA